jgi:hypothetical protein
MRERKKIQEGEIMGKTKGRKQNTYKRGMHIGFWWESRKERDQ